MPPLLFGFLLLDVFMDFFELPLLRVVLVDALDRTEKSVDGNPIVRVHPYHPLRVPPDEAERRSGGYSLAER